MPSVNDFLAALNKNHGPARPHSYLVHITSLKIGSRLNDACMMCDAIELPGKTFKTTDFQMYGPQRKMPTNVQYTDLNMSFICSSRMVEKRYLEFWQGLISDPEDYSVGYYDEYVAEMYIFTLDQQHKVSYGIRVEEVYPLALSPITMAYAEQNTYMKLPVQMTYKKWVPLPVTLDDYLPTINFGSFGNDLINSLVNF